MSTLPLKHRLQRFGEKLRSLRLAHELTLQQFAETLDYHAHGYISELESGKKMPTLEFVLNIAHIFEVTTDELLKDEIEMQPVKRQPDGSAEKPKPLSLAFVQREPTSAEFEKLRLLLSTFQDGSGMLAQHGKSTLPGWRDFERAVATAFGGENQENKAIFDVLIQDTLAVSSYGISCKMRAALDRVSRDGRVTIELSNSAKKFSDYLLTKGILPEAYKDRAAEVGINVIELIEGWKADVSIPNGGNIDLANSGYLVLLYNQMGDYQLFWFDLKLPDPRTLHWYYPALFNKSGQQRVAGHLNGDDHTGGRLFEWYFASGGQLKYYPLALTAKWQSPRFRLEPLPIVAEKFSLKTKAQTYFPRQWSNTEG